MGQKHRKLLLAGSLLLVNVLVFMIALAKTNEMVKMPVAKEAILPRMKITEEMVAYIEVPKQAVRNNMYQSKKAIIGKVAAIEGLIPKGSFFYKGAIEASDTLKDAPALALKKGQSAFSLSCNLLKSAGNSIVAFQHVDVYVTIDDRSAGMKSDVLLQNCLLYTSWVPASILRAIGTACLFINRSIIGFIVWRCLVIICFCYSVCF